MSNALALCVLVGQVYGDAVSWVYHKKSHLLGKPSIPVRGDSRPLCQASEWEYSWDSEAGKRSPWQPSEEGQHVRLCTGLPHGSRWDPLVSSSLGTGDTRDFIESPAGRGGWSIDRCDK